MEESDKARNKAVGQPTPGLKPYSTPTLTSYGALKELTKGGSEPMMEGDGTHANRMA
jgi:hypothetical protein